MNLLAIDTSGPVCGVAVMKNDMIVYEASAMNKLTHSVNLIPMINIALDQSGMTLQDCDRLAVVSGPGSFTGVRIGISTIKGLAHGSGKPCVAVDALEAMAVGITYYPGIVCPLQDARAGQVYGAAFRVQNGSTERLSPDEPIVLEEHLQKLSLLGDRFLFLGDGMPVHRKRINEILGGKAEFAAPSLAFLRPASVALLAAKENKTMDYLSLMPSYLRAPSAERNKKLMEAAGVKL